MTDQNEFDKFEQLVLSTNTTNPEPKNVQSLQAMLQEHPELIEYVGELSTQSRNILLYGSHMTPPAQAIAHAEIDQLSTKLGYETASPLERLIIDQILTCHIRLYLWEYFYHNKIISPKYLENIEKFEKLVNSSQRQLFRSIETLTRVRKLGINIQVNIANLGDQQVNIANSTTNPVMSKVEK